MKLLVEDRFRFGECESVFVDAILLAQTRFAVARVKRCHAFIKNIEPAIDKRGRVIVVECVVDVFSGVFRPARGHHLHFADFVIPKLLAGSEIENVNERPAFESFARAILCVFCENDREQI